MVSKVTRQPMLALRSGEAQREPGLFVWKLGTYIHDFLLNSSLVYTQLNQGSLRFPRFQGPYRTLPKLSYLARLL